MKLFVLTIVVATLQATSAACPVPVLLMASGFVEAVLGTPSKVWEDLQLYY